MFSKPNKLNSLRSQITVIYFSIILLTVFALVASFFFAVSDYTAKQTERRINNANRVLSQYLDEKERLLITAARVLTADFGFREAVATGDKLTIESVLANHGKRINADLMSLIDLDGQVTSTNIDNSELQQSRIQALIANSKADVASNLFSVSDGLYQVIVLPVEAPRAIAYALIGFSFDQQTFSELKELTGLDISVFANQIAVVTSLPSRMVAYSHFVQSQQNNDSLLARPDYKFQLSPITDNENLTLLLSASLEIENEEFNLLLQMVSLLALVLLAITVLVSSVLSRSVTQPLYRLVKFTKAIGSGVFTEQIKTEPQSREVKELYSAFNKMNQAIKQREQEIVFTAEHDLLTKLLNRHSIIKLLEQWCPDKSLMIVSLSIINFREMNDSMGPKIGDTILQKFASRLDAFTKQVDVNQAIGRISDNNFIYIQELNTTSNFDSLVSGLISYLSSAYLIQQFSVELTLSAGVLKTPQDGTDPDTILRRLMIVSTEAKSQQNKLAFYQPGQDDQYLQRIAILDELRSTLQSETPSLFMVYQPKFDFKKQSYEKVEALIRWINADGEFVNPELFISLAENSGLIIPLTRWVIAMVLKQLSQWDQQGEQLSVSINVSAMDILHEGFIEHLIEQTDSYHIDNDRVTIELTERDLAECEDSLLMRLNNLKSLGFKISVDDYGIGQSSLSKLKNLPVDELKIDKSFILQLDQSKVDQDIVKSTISLSHQLNLSVVAEGVENSASKDLLEAFNCDLIQGYYLSKPLSSDALLQWVKDVKTHS